MTNTLKVHRAMKGITQAQLASLVKVSRQTIIAIESGKYVPSTVLALRLSHVFDVEPSVLFQLEASDWD